MEGDDCTEDYIVIPDNGKNNNRYCGSGLSNIVSKFRDNNNYGFKRLPAAAPQPKKKRQNGNEEVLNLTERLT